MEGLRKTTKNLGKVSRCPGLDLNRTLPEYKSDQCVNIYVYTYTYIYRTMYNARNGEWKLWNYAISGDHSLEI
jgi:hypothetical protein